MSLSLSLKTGLLCVVLAVLELSVDLADLKLRDLLPLLPKCLDLRCAPPSLDLKKKGFHANTKENKSSDHIKYKTITEKIVQFEKIKRMSSACMTAT